MVTALKCAEVYNTAEARHEKIEISCKFFKLIFSLVNYFCRLVNNQ